MTRLLYSQVKPSHMHGLSHVNVNIVALSHDFNPLELVLMGVGGKKGRKGRKVSLADSQSGFKLTRIR